MGISHSNRKVGVATARWNDAVPPKPANLARLIQVAADSPKDAPRTAHDAVAASFGSPVFLMIQPPM
jgi:hypothetical protein